MLSSKLVIKVYRDVVKTGGFPRRSFLCCAMSGRGEYYKQKYGGGRGGGRRGGRSGGEGGGRRGGRNSQGTSWSESDSRGNHSNDAAEPDYGRETFIESTARLSGTFKDLHNELMRIDGAGYKAYNDIRGRWHFASDGIILCCDHTQSDPFAPPSKFRVQLASEVTRFDPALYHTKVRRIALGDWLSRVFKQAVREAGADIRKEAHGWGGEKGGEMGIDAGGQHVLERTSVLVNGQGAVEARFTIALPARGRSVLGQWASTILVQNLPKYAVKGLTYPMQDQQRLQRHIQCVEDTEFLRAEIAKMGLISFVGNGSILPRISGASDKPMEGDSVIRFKSPPSMEIDVVLPNAGKVSGMGIKPGVTLIVGGGFHGKSTLLKALEAGVTNKIPKDGRELVVTIPTAFKVRAEDGRRVEGVDLTPFISNLPFGRSTNDFRTDDASGSTSQAANIMEALEVGANPLLIDEDTTATNFMIRDARMQALIAPDKEPITPLISKIRSLVDKGVSCILVVGGSGDYFQVADTVIAMDCFSAGDVTQQAKQISSQHSLPAVSNNFTEFGPITRRVPLSLLPSPGGSRDLKTVTKEIDDIRFGDVDLDLSAVEQIFDKSQSRAIAEAILHLRSKISDPATIDMHLSRLEEDLDKQGLDVLMPSRKSGNLARPRKLEIAAALNRLRTLKVRQTR